MNDMKEAMAAGVPLEYRKTERTEKGARRSQVSYDTGKLTGQPATPEMLAKLVAHHAKRIGKG